MKTVAFEMNPEQVKEFLIHQCKIAESLGGVKVIQIENGMVFFDKSNEEVLRVNF